MNCPRRVCIVTDSRAEYGHMRWLIHDLREDLEVELQVVVAGAHLSPWHGNTISEISADGIEINERVDMLLASDGPLAVTKSIGLGVIGFAEAFSRLGPAIVVILGDRFEMLAAAQAALVLRIPIAHLHGGEVTEGAIDEAIRHSITKMSHLHFVAAEPYRRRVIQLGEDPARVFNFGAPGLDHLTRTTFLSRADLEEFLGLRLAPPTLLVTHHPATLSDEEPSAEIRELVMALEAIPEATVILTGVNADPGSASVAKIIHDFADRNCARVRLFESLGSLRFLSLMRLCNAVVGNSSSGIIEAPAFGVPSINIGDRQRGRLQADSILNCSPDNGLILAALHRALSPDIQTKAQHTVSVYGAGDASRQIIRVLKTYPLGGLIIKSFYEVAGIK
jgi:UDP-hydrolysing UDP-N-acetyl-D-glucosamine 2-epimerase